MGKLNVLAYDFGSSGGKVIRCQYDGKTLSLDTVHEFLHRAARVHGSDYWDILRMHEEAVVGLAKAIQETPDIHSIAFSSWGVDYGLLDASGKLMGNVYSYRDDRTQSLYEQIFEIIPQEQLYNTTGIMFMPFNTLVQLYADQLYQPYLLDNARAMLLLPDLFTYLFSGQLVSEITISSTTQMLDLQTFDWTYAFLDALGIPKRILQPIAYPGDLVGTITAEKSNVSGAARSVKVVATGGHDTSSAIVATPIHDPARTAFISVGSWSLLGMELDGPILTEAAFRANFTNEIGVGNKIAFHKIIAGMWLTQGLRLDWARNGRTLSYNEMAQAAELAPSFEYLFDPDSERLMNPQRMVDAISDCVRIAGGTPPSTIGEFTRAVYECLALNYRNEINVLERLTSKTIKIINVVGGGSRAELLCQLVADATGREVIAGPAEATSVGNALVQLMATGQISSLTEGRNLVEDSFILRKYQPSLLHAEAWNDQFQRFIALKG